MFRHLFRTNKIFRNSTILLGGFTADIILDKSSDYLYKNNKFYDEKLDNELFILYCKDTVEIFKDSKLFNIYNTVEIPLYATIEEIMFRDCGMQYFLMSRLGLSGGISNIIQSIGFSFAHDTINPNEIKNKYVNMDEKLAIYYLHYYSYLFTSGLIYGGATLLSKTIWIPSVLHTIHNQFTMYNNRKLYFELTKKNSKQ